MGTQRVPCSDFTRIKTVRLPPVLASFMARLTSAGAFTGLPPTSRITSPALKPCAGAEVLTTAVEDHVAGLEAVRGRRTILFDLRHHDALTAAAGHARGRRER